MILKKTMEVQRLATNFKLHQFKYLTDEMNYSLRSLREYISIGSEVERESETVDLKVLIYQAILIYLVMRK